MKIKFNLLTAFLLAVLLFSNSVLAEWSTVNPEFIQNFPTGNVAFWSKTAFLNGCGVFGKAFRIEVNLHGVTPDGVKSMLATLLTAQALGKSINVHYFETEPECRVDSMTFLK